MHYVELEGGLLKLDGAMLRPGLRRLLVRDVQCRLGGKAGISEDTLNRNDVLLDFGSASDKPVLLRQSCPDSRTGAPTSVPVTEMV
jgi:hypothetical protein